MAREAVPDQYLVRRRAWRTTTLRQTAVSRSICRSTSIGWLGKAHRWKWGERRKPAAMVPSEALRTARLAIGSPVQFLDMLPQARNISCREVAISATPHDGRHV